MMHHRSRNDGGRSKIRQVATPGVGFHLDLLVHGGTTQGIRLLARSVPVQFHPQVATHKMTQRQRRASSITKDNGDSYRRLSLPVC